MRDYAPAALAVLLLLVILLISAASGWHPGCQYGYGHDPGQRDHFSWTCRDS